MRKMVLLVWMIVLAFFSWVRDADAGETIQWEEVWSATNSGSRGGYDRTAIIHENHWDEYCQKITVNSDLFIIHALVARYCGYELGDLKARIRQADYPYTIVLDNIDLPDPGSMWQFEWVASDTIPIELHGDYLFCVYCEGGASVLLFGEFVIAEDASPAPNESGMRWQESLGWLYNMPDYMIYVEQKVGVAPNQPPVANAGPDNTVTKGVPFKLDGTNSYDSDDPYDSLSFMWTWTEGGTQYTATIDTPTVTINTVGQFPIILEVTDPWGLSDTDTVVITVREPSPPNQLPTAYIDTIFENPELVGFPITFRGHGTDSDGSVVAWKWESSLDGIIKEGQGSSCEFQRSNLSIGEHTIYFYVQDDSLEWSTPAKSTLVIADTPQVNFNTRFEWIQPDFTYKITVYVNVVNDAVPIDWIHVYLEDGQGGPVLDDFREDADIPAYGTIELTLKRTGNWNWDPWNCCSPIPAGPLEQQFTEAVRVVIQDIHEHEPPSYYAEPPSLTHTEYVPDWKIAGVAAAFNQRADAVAISALSPLAGPLAAVAGAVAEATLAAASALTCDIAHDPPPADSNYQERVELNFPSLELIPSVAGYGIPALTAAADYATGLLGLFTSLKAYYAAYAKMLGAEIYNDLPYVKLQAKDVIRYGSMAADWYNRLKVSRMTFCQEILNTITEEDIGTFIDSVATYGLPPEEINTLQELGFSESEIADIQARIVAMDPAEVMAGLMDSLTDEFNTLANLYCNEPFYSVPPSPYPEFTPEETFTWIYLAITSPRDSAAVCSTVVIDGRIVDKDYPVAQKDSAQVFIDANLVSNSLPYMWNTTSVEDGWHHIMVQATDGVFVDFDMLDVLVDNTPPVISTDLTDIDPTIPGIQIRSGTTVSWNIEDPPAGPNGTASGVVGPTDGFITYCELGDTNLIISARDAAGNHTVYSASLTVIPVTEILPTLIYPPDDTILNDNTPTFIWSATVTNGSYTLRYALDSLFTLGVVEITGLTDTTYTVEPLSDTVYYWCVQAISSECQHSGYQEHPFKFTIDTEAPGVPTLVSPTGGVYLNDSLVVFEWTQVTLLSVGTQDALSIKGIGVPVRYVVEVDTSLSFTEPIVDTVATTVDTLKLGENFYYWRVMAYDLAGNQGNYANPDSFGVDMTAPNFSLTTIWTDTSFGGPYPVTSVVTDALSGVDSVLLYYRVNNGVWQTTPMVFEDSLYRGEIPEVDTVATIDYYLWAIDLATNVATDPAGAPTVFYSFNRLGIAEQKIPKPTVFDLYQSTPNPCVCMTIIQYQLPIKSRVSLRIYDVTGKLVRTLVDQPQEPGYYRVVWDGRDDFGKEVTSGIYFYRLEAGSYTAIRKLILMK